MERHLRVGIIGTGDIAVRQHIPHYLTCPEVDVIAVADIVTSKAATCANQFSIPDYYDDYKTMLAEAELDAVSVCTPNKFHYPATVAALQAGCHVLCEKPPAISAAEAADMAAVADKCGKILTYGFHYRYSSEVETLKRFIDANELGEIYAARADAVRRRGIPGWGVFTNKDLQGGGPLIDIGVHMLDIALYLMGYPQPALVVGSSYQRIGDRPGVGLLGDWDPQQFTVEDMARGFIRFSNGASLIVESAFAANVKAREVMQVRLMGDLGGADVFPLNIYQEKHGALVDTTPVYLPSESCYQKQIEHFVVCCLHGKQPVSTANQGTILQRIVEALYKSAQTGEAICF